MWEPGLAAPVCVFAGAINAVSMWIFMGCCRNWGRRVFTKYQSLTPAIYFYAFLSIFALIKQGEFHRVHSPKEAVPEALLGLAEP